MYVRKEREDGKRNIETRKNASTLFGMSVF